MHSVVTEKNEQNFHPAHHIFIQMPLTNQELHILCHD
jgi:hypothetical protein